MHSFTATQTSTSFPNYGKFTSAQGSASSVTVYAPTPAPSVTSTTPGSVGTAGKVAGRGIPNGDVLLYEGTTNLVGMAHIDLATGTWLATLNLLPLGVHTLNAKQKDPASGFWSALGSAFTVTINPNPATISFVSVQTAAAAPTASFTVSGTGVNGYAIKLYDNGVPLSPGGSVAAGGWSITVLLTAGAHSLTATQTSPVSLGSLTSAASAPMPVTVLAPPAAPAITGKVAGAVSTPATVSGLRVTNGVVQIFEGSTQVGTTFTNPATTTWTATLALLSLGNHTLTARQQDPATGYWSAFGPAFTVTINPNTVTIMSVSPQTAPAGPTASFTVSGNGGVGVGYTVKIYDNGVFLKAGPVTGGSWSISVSLTAGPHSLTAIQTSPGGFSSAPSGAAPLTVYGPTANPTISSAPANVITSNAFTVSGVGIPNAPIAIYDGSNPIPVWSGTVSLTGAWFATFTLSTTGLHALTVKQQSPVSGFWSSGAAFWITSYGRPTINAILPPPTTLSTVTITISGTGTPNQSVTILDGTTPIKTANVNGSGTWTAQITLAIGIHSLTATQSPAPGLTGVASSALVVTVLHI